MKRLLAAVAILPLACTKPSETPSRGGEDASIAPDPPSAVSASASESASSGLSKKEVCEALQKKVQTIYATGRACTTSADCTNVWTTVGLLGQCGLPVSKASSLEVKKITAEFQAKHCLDVLPPQPTASCPVPAPPACVNSVCN